MYVVPLYTQLKMLYRRSGLLPFETVFHSQASSHCTIERRAWGNGWNLQ